MKKQEIEKELIELKETLIALEVQIKGDGREFIKKAHNCRLLKQTYSEGWNLGENAYAQIMALRLHNILKKFEK